MSGHVLSLVSICPALNSEYGDPSVYLANLSQSIENKSLKEYISIVYWRYLYSSSKLQSKKDAIILFACIVSEETFINFEIVKYVYIMQ